MAMDRGMGEVALLALVFAAVALAVWGVVRLLETWLTQGRRLRRRLQAAADPGSAHDAAWAGSARGWWPRLAAWTAPVQGLATPHPATSASADAPLQRTLRHAGIHHRQAAAAVWGMKAMLAMALPAVGGVLWALRGAPWQGAAPWALLLALAAIGHFAPSWLLGMAARRRQRALFEAFPDALDLLTVCVEAGLSTEAALKRVADDIGPHSPVLGEELQQVSLALQAGMTREQALRGLARRTGVEEIEAFVTMLLQAERFGTRVAPALRVHAEGLRTRRRQQAEEAAAKVALKLLFPLVFCIFPSLLVVLMGPAMIQIHRVLLPSMAGGG
jgi:tight adherence protein C